VAGHRRRRDAHRNNLNVQHIIIAIFTVGVVGLVLEQAMILLARRFSYE
jgi:nitrate/nitrite transport system permease protein